MDKEIDLEKKIKELDNIVYKVGQSAQTLHMLTKPQVFYNDTHKQALGYQNPFYLKKAQRIKPTLYDGNVISSQHAASPVIDDEETLILEEILKGRIQEKVFVTTTLQSELRKLKGKHVLDNATTIAPGMFKLDIEPLSHRLKNNIDAYKDYLKKTIQNTNTIRGLVQRARKQNPSEPLLDSTCKFTKHVQELLVYVSQTCPRFIKPSEKLVAVTPMNKDMKVRIEVVQIVLWVYYVERLGHNLFSVGQFCDADLEVAFQKNTFFIRNLAGVDLLLGSRDTNLYTISLEDMLKTSPICLLSKASKTKSWLWHRRLSHLNFGTLNKLAKDGLA
ncbi:retrovirus-related pol polyprotein from transposon TNT 1-94 [Tanacetum coccineum]